MRITDISSVSSFIASLPHDRVTVLTGRNGAGKTTLLDALSGEISLDDRRPSGSTSHTAGSDPAHHFSDPCETGTVRPDCAYCEQGFYSLSTLSVRENIRFARSIDGLSGPAAIGNSEASLNRLESLLSGRLRTRAGRLSGGEGRLLSVVCTCLLARNLYLFDEPLAGVDSTNAPIVAAAISSLVPAPANPADGTKALTALTVRQRQARALRTVIVVTHGKEQAALFPGANVLTLERD